MARTKQVAVRSSACNCAQCRDRSFATKWSAELRWSDGPTQEYLQELRQGRHARLDHPLQEQKSALLRRWVPGYWNTTILQSSMHHSQNINSIETNNTAKAAKSTKIIKKFKTTTRLHTMDTRSRTMQARAEELEEALARKSLAGSR
jgi:hypothetical protein